MTRHEAPGVDQRHVGGCTDGNSRPLQAEDRRRAGGHSFEHRLRAGAHRARRGRCRARRRLSSKAGDSERRRLERTSFSSGECGAWSVAIAAIVPSRNASSSVVSVAPGAQRRVHLDVRVECAHGVVGQAQVMRSVRSRRSRADAAASWAAPKMLDRLARREMPWRWIACPVSAARSMSRATIKLSPREGQPPSPSSAATAAGVAHVRHASATAPRKATDDQSGPLIALYWSARRITPAAATGRPSSVKPTAPASASAGPSSVSSCAVEALCDAAKEAHRKCAVPPPQRAREGHGGCLRRPRQAPCWVSQGWRSSRPQPQRLFPTQVSPRPLGRACADARAGRRTRARA